MNTDLMLVSHHLCPYVQRAVISLKEKNVPFERVFIDLSHKPEWFLKISPLGRVPVLKVNDTAVFESAVILEYLEETLPKSLHPADPLRRAEHRSWIEFGSSVLNDIAGFYNAKDKTVFREKADSLSRKFNLLEARIAGTPYFDGSEFSLVDAVFGPVFRYFDIFDGIGDFGILADKPRIKQWRKSLAERPSVEQAVPEDYADRLRVFLLNRNSYLTSLMQAD